MSRQPVMGVSTTKLLGLLALLLVEVVPARGRHWTHDWARNWGNSQHNHWDNYFESLQESLQAGIASGARKIKDEWSKLKGQFAEESEYWNAQARRSWEEGSDYWCGKQSKRDRRKEESLKREARDRRHFEDKLQKARRDAQHWERQVEKLWGEVKANERSIQEHERALNDCKSSQELCRRDEEKMEELREVLHRYHGKIDLCEERLAEANCSWAGEIAAQTSSFLEPYVAGALLLAVAVGWYLLSQRRIRSLASALESQSSLLATLRTGNPGVEDLQGELHQLREEAEAKDARIAKLEHELYEELGVVSAQGSNSELCSEFSFGVLDEEQAGGHLTRTLKIHCPGVVHDDVSLEVIFNGCVVTIARQASFGVQATTWSRRFQFRISEGVFELADERARLEHGFLHLVFRGRTCPARVFRLTPHFTMEALDVDSDSWLPSDDSGGASPTAAAKPTAPGGSEDLYEGVIGSSNASVRSSSSACSWTQVDVEDEAEHLCLE